MADKFPIRPCSKNQVRGCGRSLFRRVTKLKKAEPGFRQTVQFFQPCIGTEEMESIDADAAVLSPSRAHNIGGLCQRSHCRECHEFEIDRQTERLCQVANFPERL